jgi:hypothetical protein
MPAGATLAAKQGEDETYVYRQDAIFCKTRTTDNDGQEGVRDRRRGLRQDRRVWTPWVGVKRERELDVKLVWHRPSASSDYVVGQYLQDIPTVDTAECDAG